MSPGATSYWSLIETSNTSSFGDPTLNRSSDLRPLLMRVKIAMIPSEIINIINIIIKISMESLTINTSLSRMPIYHTPSFMVDAVPTQKSNGC